MAGLPEDRRRAIYAVGVPAGTWPAVKIDDGGLRGLHAVVSSCSVASNSSTPQGARPRAVPMFCTTGRARGGAGRGLVKRSLLILSRDRGAGRGCAGPRRGPRACAARPRRGARDRRRHESRRRGDSLRSAAPTGPGSSRPRRGAPRWPRRRRGGRRAARWRGRLSGSSSSPIRAASRRGSSPRSTLPTSRGVRPRSTASPARSSRTPRSGARSRAAFSSSSASPSPRPSSPDSSRAPACTAERPRRWSGCGSCGGARRRCPGRTGCPRCSRCPSIRRPSTPSDRPGFRPC